MKPETEAHLLRLTEAQTDCPGPTDASVNLDYYAYPVSGQSPHSPACICKGTGKVPLFPDVVRVECPSKVRQWETRPVHPANCPICDNKGKVPSTDPMVWAKSLFPVLSAAQAVAVGVHTEVEAYIGALIRGDFDAAIPHAVKALELAGLLEAANEPTG